ncbi:tumor necrosis factor ligand superfamily member 13B isoform X2 [Lissotriton helveticus]
MKPGGYHMLTTKGVPAPSYENKLFSAAFLIVITAISSSLAALSLYHVIIMKAELARFRQELKSYSTPAATSHPPREGEVNYGSTDHLPVKSSQGSGVSSDQADGSFEDGQPVKVRAPRFAPAAEGEVMHACLQLIADKRSVPQQGTSSTVPWILSFKRGAALEERKNNILVKETGYFFIYGQVWYQDTRFAMGHLIQRRKAHIVGDDPSLVTLFRCIQNMPKYQPNNSCYTAGNV